MAKCPYCQKQVTIKANTANRDTLLKREVEGFLKKEVLYSCPHCECVLGFATFFGGLLTQRPFARE